MVVPSCQCETLGHGSNRRGRHLAEQGTFIASDYVEIWWRFRFSFGHGIEMKVCFDPFHTCVNRSCFSWKHHGNTTSAYKCYQAWKSMLHPYFHPNTSQDVHRFFPLSDIFPHLRDFDVMWISAMAPCPTLYCPKKHGLQQGPTPLPGRLCDTCNVTIRPGNDRFACEAW